MTVPEPSFTVGIEEEYLLVDLETRDLVESVPPTLMDEVTVELGERVSPEFLQCQIEVGTSVHTSMREARAELAMMRRTVSDHANNYGLGIIAASTHPFAKTGQVQRTEKERYDTLADEMGGVAERLMISGMHVHVGIEDPDLRIDLMNQAKYALPHFLALSTSSPFWHGHDTGLRSYRIAVWDEMPRTGLPEHFESWHDYESHVQVLIDVGILEDATKIWWDLRPSARFPTLEMRIADLCPLIDDGIAIAALYRCWLRYLWRLRRSNVRFREYSRLLIDENRWRAHRYGLDEGLVDFGRRELVPVGELIEELIALVHEDAEALDCVAEIEHARVIVERGTSAHRQVATYSQSVNQGSSSNVAIQDVVEELQVETMSVGLNR